MWSCFYCACVLALDFLARALVVKVKLKLFLGLPWICALRHMLQSCFVNDMLSLVKKSTSKENSSGQGCPMNEPFVGLSICTLQQPYILCGWTTRSLSARKHQSVFLPRSISKLVLLMKYILNPWDFMSFLHQVCFLYL